MKYLLEVINLSVYIFGKFRLFYVSGEQIVEKVPERVCYAYLNTLDEI